MYQLVELTELEQAPIDLWQLLMQYREFLRLIDIDVFDFLEAKERLLYARIELDSARTLLIQLLDSEENKYIRENKKSFDWLMDNVSRFDKRLDDKEKFTMDIMDKEMSLFKSDKKTEAYDWRLNLENVMAPSSAKKLLGYKRELVEAGEHLLFYPLKMAFKKYQDIDKPNKIILENQLPLDENDRLKLFQYFIFVYLFHASKILGGLAREDSPGSIRNRTTSTFSTSGTGNELITPPSMPKDMIVQEREDELSDNLENYFAMPGDIGVENETF